jgi:signal transduction histidine kinase
VLRRFIDRPSSRPAQNAAVRRVRTALFRAGTGLGLVNLALTAYNLVRLPDAYRFGFGWLSCAILAVELAWCAQQCVTREPDLLPMRVVVATSYLVLSLHPLVLSPDFRGYPPLLHVLGAGMSLTALGFGPMAATLGVPAFAAYVGVLRTPVLGPGPAAIEASLQSLGGLVVAATVFLLERAASQVEQAVESEWVAREQATRAARRAIERVRWDGLIHDKVLGALLGAGRAPEGPIPHAARELADQATAAITGDTASAASELVPVWREQARRLGLVARFAVTGEMTEPDVHAAVVEAVGELLANVARHSGQHEVFVEGSVSPSHVTLVVRDEGRGFTPDSAPARAGLRTVRARMALVGGAVNLWSAPALGTRVTLTWDAHVSGAPSATEEVSRAQWSLRAFTPMMTLGAGVVVITVLLGSRHWLAAPAPEWAVVSVAAVIGVTVAVSLLPATSRWMLASAAVIAVLPTLVAVNHPADAGPDWRYWQLSALTPALGAVAFRSWPGLGWVVAAVAVSGVGVVDALHGRSFFSAYAGPLPVLLVTVVSGHLLRLTLDESWDQVAHATRTAADWRLREAVEEERTREARRRVGTLERLAAPALVIVQHARALTSAQQRELLVIEATIRDQLTAPGLVDPATEACLHAARTRGVRIELVRTDIDEFGQVPTVDRPAVQRARLALGIVLGQAANTSRVRMQWHPGKTPYAATLSYLGPDARAVDQAFLRAARLPGSALAASPERPGRGSVRTATYDSATLLEF